MTLFNTFIHIHLLTTGYFRGATQLSHTPLIYTAALPLAPNDNYYPSFPPAAAAVRLNPNDYPTPLRSRPGPVFITTLQKPSAKILEVISRDGG